MSSRRDVERKEKEDIYITALWDIRRTCNTTQIPPNRQWKHQQSLNRVLEETRDKIRKSVDEARNHIPRYTEIVNDYQEQAIQAAREIWDNYLESQKDIIILALVSQIDAYNRTRIKLDISRMLDWNICKYG